MRSLFDIGGYVSVFLLALVFGLMVSIELQAQDTLEFEDAEIRVEINSTDEDAGFQLFADGEPWQRIRVKGPDGRQVYAVTNRGKLRELGSTEFFTESNEPNYEEVSLPDILSFMPEGEYKFEGFTIDRQRITGSAELTHDLPCGPEIIYPTEEDVVDPNEELVISWMPVINQIDTSSPTGECSGEGDLEIVHYELIMEVIEPESELKLSVIIPGDKTDYMVSNDIILPGAQYKYEVIAREESGNQTITEVEFFTSE